MTIFWIEKETLGSVKDLIRAMEHTPNALIGLKTKDLLDVIKPDVEKWIQEADIVHSGLSFGSERAFQSVQLCTFNWYFLTPDKNRASVSWKATTDFVCFEKNLIKRIGPLDEAYSSPDAALMDWVYRAMVAGAKTIHLPFQVPGNGDRANVKVSLQDEMLFVSKHFNQRAQSFFRFCHFFLSGKLLKSIKRTANHEQIDAKLSSFKLTSSHSVVEIHSYAALIPTIDRYDYITKSIDSLLSLAFPPSEIVVVDQTPLVQRRPNVYEPYLKKGVLKLVYLDRAGQSTARNRGLAEVTKAWVLLFEDDSEAWPDMVDEHISLIRKSGCDVSTGVIVPPGADRTFILPSNRKYFLADILTTGNAFMKTETALSVGGFDPAFDRGPGADDDFGKRLYKAGKIIVYNFKSIETHHKAPQGGMRVHGIWWRNKSTLLGPYPPVTQSYVIMKYYPRKYRFFLFLNMILKARKKYSIISYLVFFIFLPYKLSISVRQAGKISKAYEDINSGQ